MDLRKLLEGVPKVSPTFDFGEDINEVHSSIFDTSDAEKIEALIRAWAKRFQPCAFGKMASQRLSGLDFHMTVVTEDQLQGDPFQLYSFLQAERMAFKDKAINGLCSAHLVFFVSRSLAFAAPSDELVKIQELLCGLHLPECMPIREDIIYTESVPLKRQNGIEIFKAGINLFYPTAHLTRNHDRRVPAGLLISVNAPGHYLASGIDNGVFDDVQSGLKHIRKLTEGSVGVGGIKHPQKLSTTWHRHHPVDRAGCPLANTTGAYYSGFYHTDVLIPGGLTRDARALHAIDKSDTMIFDWNVLFYVSMEEFATDSPYYGEFIGIPVTEDAIYFNPFAPRAPNHGPLT